MSKKLKKKIEELCGMEGKPWETRAELAQKILDSKDRQQKICNQLPGLAFRELERFLNSVLNERIAKEANEAARSKVTRDSRGSKSASSSAAPRSLQEILAQVYAPRETRVLTRQEKESLRRPKEDGTETAEQD